MKVDEIMIGDWILIPMSNVPIKVTGVNDEGVTVYNEDDYTEYPYYISDIEPIPLTEEILEKNGFKEHRYYGYFIGQSNSGYYIYFDNKYLSIQQSGYDIIEFAWCEYVHELQHALKLCGIKKEIIL